MATESRQHGARSAVAIAYQDGAGAPTVVAKGSGLIADQIILRARENGVHVHESKELLSLLMEVDLDRQIPPALYRAIAELLAWLYHVEKSNGNGVAIAPLPQADSHLSETSIDSHANQR